MIKYENHCIGCQLPCIYTSCPHYSVEVHYCDKCKKKEAICIIDGDDYCDEHAEEYMQDILNEMSLQEKADVLSLEFTSIKK